MNADTAKMMEPHGSIELQGEGFRPNAHCQAFDGGIKLIVVRTVDCSVPQREEVSRGLATLYWQQREIRIFGRKVFTWRQYVGFEVLLPVTFYPISHRPRVCDVLIQLEYLVNSVGEPRTYPLGVRGMRQTFFDQAGNLRVDLFP